CRLYSCVSLSCACSTLLLLHHVTLFLFNASAAAAIYTLSLHDALPICIETVLFDLDGTLINSNELIYLSFAHTMETYGFKFTAEDRKSTRLNSSHVSISYAVFCLKKKKTNADRTMDELVSK